jgi:O-antigen ligase
MFGLRAIVFAAMGLLGSGVSLLRPYLGLLALGVLYFFRPDLYGAEEYITPIKWLTVAILIGYLVKRREGPILAGNGWLVLVLAMYLVSTIFAPYSNVESWDRLWMIAKILIVVFLIDKLCTSPRLLAGFVAALLVGGIYFLKVAILSWRSAGWGDVRADADIGQGGGSNYTSWILAALIPFLYYKAMRGKGWQRWVSIGLIPLWILAIIATGSRGGLLCLGAATGVFLLLMRRFTVVAAGAVGVVLFMSYAPATYLQRMSTITTDPEKMDASELTRWQNFQIGQRIIADYPLLGTGLETFPEVKLRYVPPEYRGASFHVAHNTYIQMGSEVGLLFLGTFVVLNLLAAWRLLGRSRAPDPRQRDDLEWVRVGTLSALVATWVQMTKADVAQADIFWWIYGLAFTCYHLRKQASAAAAEQQKVRPRAAASQGAGIGSRAGAMAATK